MTPPRPVVIGSVILIGPMGSGKSSAARSLASLLGHRFSDTDRLVVQRAGQRVSEIFDREGEAAFRQREREALLELKGWSRHVIATGGGIVETPENVETLRSMGCVVWLRASLEVLWRRVATDMNRPLLQVLDPRAALAQTVAKREPLYSAAAHVSVDTSGLTAQQVVTSVHELVVSFFLASRPPAA